MQSWFYPLNQTVDTGDFKFIDADFSWLADIKKDCYCLMNIATDPKICPMVPDGHSMYVLSWLFEPFGDLWFLDLYNRNPQAQFVIISDLNPNDLVKLDRVEYFQIMHHATWFKAIHLKNTKPHNINLSNRKYKLSSLSSRLNEYKFYITAKLHDKKNSQTLYTWNRGFDITNKDSFVFESHGLYHVDKMLDYTDFLKNNTINQEQWDNNPLSGCNFAHSAYLDTVINSINETQCLSYTPEFGRLPTPYITEKTWKPLFAGNAILFTGQAGLKKQLESWGFEFDYVWAQDYDGSFSDNQRLEVILSQINWILATNIDDLAHWAQPSTEHNFELAWSGKLEQQFAKHNQQVIAELQDFIHCN